MRRFKKLVHVLLVIGAAALMSVPFKRVPPQDTKKNAGRGEWQLVKPDIPFRDLLKGGDPATKLKSAGPASGEAGSANASARSSKSSGVRGSSKSSGAGTSGEIAPSGTDRPSGSTRSILPDQSPVPAAEPPTGTVPAPSVSYSRPTAAMPVPEPLSDREVLKRARALRIPRINPLPEPSERLEDDTGLPSLPADFTPL